MLVLGAGGTPPSVARLPSPCPRLPFTLLRFWLPTRDVNVTDQLRGRKVSCF